jgi:hypothetical protein
MSGLSWVYICKIFITLVFWSLPLLFLPEKLIAKWGFIQKPNYIFVRLLGWAYLALCVGYGFGLNDALQGKRNLGVIWTGIVSNGGASFILGYFGIYGNWLGKNPIPHTFCWVFAFVTAAITILLVSFGVLKDGKMI